MLGALEGGRDYDSLAPETVELSVEGQRVRAELKRGSARPKDRLALAVLEETIRRQRGG